KGDAAPKLPYLLQFLRLLGAFLAPFRGAQFSAARSWITAHFHVVCRYWLFRQQPVKTTLRARAQRIFHSAVFQRVEADDYQPAATPEHRRRRFQQRLQLFQLTVYEDSDRLESARRGMNPVRFH